MCCKVFIITLKTTSTSRISISKSNSLKPNFPKALKSKIHTRIKTYNLTEYRTVSESDNRTKIYRVAVGK